MFDNVGGSSFDHDDNARQARATLLVSLLTTVWVGAMLGAGAWTLRQAPPLTLDPDVFEPMELSLVEPWQPHSAPAAPQGRAARPSSEPVSAPTTRTEPTADRPPEPAPSEPASTDQASTRATSGDSEAPGDDDGVASADSGGCVGARCGEGPGSLGSGDGVGRGGAPRVHHSDLEVRRRVLPVWPTAARGLGLGEQVCTAQLVIDATGVPTAVEVDACPALYHPNVKRALLEWRWYPPRVLGARSEVQTTIVVRFRER